MNLSIYKFRTPSLRNVALTAPYGHCGAYPTLKSVIWHHVNPSTAVARYNPEATQMPNTRTLTAEDAAVMQNSTVVRDLVTHSEISSLPLTGEEIDKIIQFLHCLTDPESISMLRGIPHRVPSGLPVYD